MIKTKLISWILVLPLAIMANSASAALVFSIEQASPAGNILANMANAAMFNVFVRSTTEEQSFIGGDFTLTLSTLDGTGGRFSAGTNQVALGTDGNAGFFEDFASPGESSVTYFLDVGPAISLGVANTKLLLAELSLSTLGASPGSYTMALSGVGGLNSGSIAIDSSAEGPLSYTVTAVPEPTSMFLLLGTAGIFGTRRLVTRSRATRRAIVL